MSDRILKRKLDTIAASDAEILVTANPGCLLQLKKGLSEQLPDVKLLHLTELLLRSAEQQILFLLNFCCALNQQHSV